MPRVNVTLKGKVVYFASRSFELEVADDDDLSLINVHSLEEIADELKVPWDFGKEGHVQATEFTIDH